MIMRQYRLKNTNNNNNNKKKGKDKEANTTDGIMYYYKL